MAFVTRGGLDSSGFRKGVAAQRAFFKKSAPEILTKQGRLLVRDLVKMTPGFDPRRGIQSQSLASQKRITEGSLKRDIRKVFQPIEDTSLAQSTGRAGQRLRELLSGTKRAVRSGKSAAAGSKAEAIQAIFLAATGTRFNIIGGATRQRHVAARNRRGRVTMKTPNLVLDKRNVMAYTKSALTHVGRGKAGWAHSAGILGYALPGWISGHTTPGRTIDHRHHATSPSITVVNQVSYRSSFETGRITSAALAIRAASMVNEMKMVQRGMARAFARKS